MESMKHVESYSFPVMTNSNKGNINKLSLLFRPFSHLPNSHNKNKARPFSTCLTFGLNQQHRFLSTVNMQEL